MDWLNLFLAPQFHKTERKCLWWSFFSSNSLVVPLDLQQHPTGRTHSISNYIPEHATPTGSLTILSLVRTYDVI